MLFTYFINFRSNNFRHKLVLKIVNSSNSFLRLKYAMPLLFTAAFFKKVVSETKSLRPAVLDFITFILGLQLQADQANVFSFSQCSKLLKVFLGALTALVF